MHPSYCHDAMASRLHASLICREPSLTTRTPARPRLMASSRSTQVPRNFDVTPLLSTVERERSWMCDILTEFEAPNPVTDRTPPNGENDRVDVPAYALSAYDAVYLALAIRLELASAAKDGPLVEAARRAGIAFA